MPDPTRVLVKLFVPGREDFGPTQSRTHVVVERILSLSEEDVVGTLEMVENDYRGRHRFFDDSLLTHAHRALHRLEPETPLSEARLRLIGACFTHEFSVEGAALCNPSMVSHPNQEGVGPGVKRFVMSVRGIGEGHRSSIGFRTGVIDQWGGISIDAPSRQLLSGVIGTCPLSECNFRGPLEAIGDYGENAITVLANLKPQFTFEEMDRQLEVLLQDRDTYRNADETVHNFHDIADRTYSVLFPPESEFSERVLWPHAESEWRGMEDARFVEFTDPAEDFKYFATYTAFDGRNISMQGLRTNDFECFEMFPISGVAAQGKGLAVFPRKIGGSYFALSRADHESNFLATSDHIECWNESTLLQVPRRPWEIIQLGNCGSPIETEAGWLAITHAVGPFRTYYLSAMLLDLHDPARVLATLNQPLLAPVQDERDGYVPNVVYSCGSMLNGRVLVIPFGISDNSIGIATAQLDDLLNHLTSP